MTQPHEGGIAPQRNNASSTESQQTKPPLPPPVPTSETGTPSRHDAREQRGEGPRWGEWALVFVTGVLAVYTYRLWRATKDAATEQAKLTVASLGEMRRAADAGSDSAKAAKTAADAAKESAESYRASERAWVSYLSFDAGRYDGTDAITGKKSVGTFFTVNWVNAGRTPAVRCRLYGDHKIVVPPFSAEAPVFAPPPPTTKSESSLIPDVAVSGTKRFIEQADIQRLNARQCKLFLYGQAVYDLVYSQATGADRVAQTEVCVEVEYLGTNNKTGEPIFTFSPTGPQNAAR